MSDDKIAEIRARHEAGPIGHLPIAAFSLADDDRAFLLAEVERLRADNEHGHRAHKIACEGGELLREEIKRLREALRWYGDRACALSAPDNKHPFSDLFEDAGARARKALEGGR